MGRTKRKRKRKLFLSSSLESDPKIIALKRWMKINGWNDFNSLRLSHFNSTGRGLTSYKSISKVNSHLIEVPFELLITYATLEGSILNNVLSTTCSHRTLEIHDLLSIYLVFERHSGHRSKWKPYIDSLPEDVPLVPWLCLPEEIAAIPKDLRAAVLDKLASFEASWRRLQQSIDPRWNCECCGGRADCVFTLHTFTWAYLMVNTRAIYVDPDIIRGFSRLPAANNVSSALVGDPSMALCPYLDMFNHSHKVSSDAKLVKINNKWKFKLDTLTKFDKYEEIFISYGAHNNVTLLCEYGFFIPDDELDVIRFDFQEILGIVKLLVNTKQYKFITHKGLNCDLYVGVKGCSFNLKAALFVMLHPIEVGSWASVVFNDNYSKSAMEEINTKAVELLQFKIEEYYLENSALNLGMVKSSGYFEKLSSYVQYRLDFMKRTLLELEKTAGK